MTQETRVLTLILTLTDSHIDEYPRRKKTRECEGSRALRHGQGEVLSHLPLAQDTMCGTKIKVDKDQILKWLYMSKNFEPYSTGNIKAGVRPNKSCISKQTTKTNQQTKNHKELLIAG